MATQHAAYQSCHCIQMQMQIPRETQREREGEGIGWGEEGLIARYLARPCQQVTAYKLPLQLQVCY